MQVFFILFFNIAPFCETLSVSNLNFQCGKDKQAIVCFDKR